MAGLTSQGDASRYGLLSAAGPIIGAGIDAVASVGSGLFAANQARKNRKFQERMYQRQLEDNRENWRMQNEYNLPINERQRLEDAGLNPLLMYGQGGISSMATSPAAGASAPHGAQAQADFRTNFGQALTQAALIREQILNLRADRELKASESTKNLADAARSTEDTTGIKYDNWYKFGTLQARIKAAQLDNDYKRAVTSLQTALEGNTQYERQKMLSEINVLEKQVTAIEQEMNNKYELTQQEIKESNQRIDNSIKMTAHQCSLMDAQSQQALASAWYSRAQASLIDTPEYRRKFLEEQVERVRKAIADGNAAEIEAGLKALKYQMQPKPGDGGFELNKFLKNYVDPLFNSVSNALSSTIGFGAKTAGQIIPAVIP